MSISAVGRVIGAVLLPQSCLLCAADCGNALLCPACHDGLPRLPDTRCPRCALPTPQGAVCGNCLKQAPHFDATVAAFDYAFPVDKLVQQLKYAHRLAVADFFANALLREELPSVELVIPLPLSNSRLRERGFNQAVEIARPIARALDLPLALTSCTRRVDTAPQAMLPWKERRKNVKNAFECTVDLGGRSLLLVDDVMTTGATLDECARVLKDHGAGTICCCVTARTV